MEVLPKIGARETLAERSCRIRGSGGNGTTMIRSCLSVKMQDLATMVCVGQQ